MNPNPRRGKSPVLRGGWHRRVLYLLSEPLGQTSGVGELPNSQDDWDNRPTVSTP